MIVCLSTIFKLIINICKFVLGHDMQSVIDDILDLHVGEEGENEKGKIQQLVCKQINKSTKQTNIPY